MRKSEKIELILLIGLNILLFLTLKEVFSSLLFFIVTIGLVLYFSSINLIRIINEGIDKNYRIAVNLLLTLMIIIS